MNGGGSKAGRMTRAGARLAVALLAGAGVTVFSSMLLALYGQWPRVNGPRDTWPERHYGTTEFPIVLRPGDTRDGFGVRFSQVWWFKAGDVVTRHDWTGLTIGDEEIIQVGWPCLAMQTPTVGFEQASSEADIGRLRREARRAPTFDGLPAWVGGRRQMQVPTTILPAGFAINTVVWGAVAAGLWASTNWMRRCRRNARRMSRGACVACGYVVGGLVRCPECGVAVRGAVA